ncbi:MAG TPA: RNA polymerase sigma factor [Vicinamibacterales bacterium]|nr:RNA polymerase sigma factor [Vicinamibacterales bacterium]
MTTHSLDAATEQLLRELTPQVIGAVVRRFGDFAAAEDAVQEALIAASIQWPREGSPANPRGWLIQVSVRRMTDFVRADSSRRRRERIAAETSEAAVTPVEPPVLELHAAGFTTATSEHEAGRDDTLVLLFMCCHPALTMSSAIALTLRAIGGLTTAQIASAFLVPESTMAQRISRAKQTIKASDVPFSMPTPGERPERLRAVLHVLYLIFNEGYTASSGPALQRSDLTAEAIRLTRAVHQLLPDDSEVGGLLALMLLTDARRAARSGPDGELIPLTTQNRELWDRSLIDEGIALVTSSLSKGAVGPYQLQAAIAALHDEAATADRTDWPQILALYGLLMRMSDNPMVSLNHAVAAAMVHGPDAGLRLVDALDIEGRLKGHHRIDAVRAHLLELAGDGEAAIRHYRRAANLTTSLPERTYLLTQAARLRS